MRLTLFALLASLVAVACTGPTNIWIDPKEPVLKTRHDRVQLVGHVMTGNVENARAQVKWTSADPKIVVVDDSGHITGVASGRTTVTARYGQLSASVPVEVSFVETVRSDMGQVELSYKKGDPIKPTVDAIGYDGRVLKHRPIFWTTKNDKVCRPDSSGQIWPVEVGETDVVATIADRSFTIHCTVAK